MLPTKLRIGRTIILMAGALGVVAASCRPASAYIEIPALTLGALCGKSTDICVLKVEKVSAEKGVILFSVVEDLKGKSGVPASKHVIGPKVPGSDVIFDWAAEGKTAVLFAAIARDKEGRGSVVQGYGYAYIDNYWYSLAYDTKGECWSALKGDPTLLTWYCGTPDKLREAVANIVGGKEVVVPCMVGGNKEDLAKRRAKVHRVRASLKLKDFDAKRDFVGWGAGGEELPPGPSARRQRPRVHPPGQPEAPAGDILLACQEVAFRLPGGTPLPAVSRRYPVLI
jgi:hypothetical protein